MPFLYIYSPSDFVTAPPDESGAAAAGSPWFNLTLRAGAEPTLVEVIDNDSVFDEIDNGQTIANDTTIDGVFYAAGSTISTAYDLIRSSTGHKVTSVHIGGDGYQQGAVDGIVSTIPLVPGQTYWFDQERTSHRQDNQYTDYTACFGEGTKILTPQGQVAVQDLAVGDRVWTLDSGAQTIRWIASTTVPAVEKFAPIVIKKGAFNNSQDLTVSPEHRVLISGPRAELLFQEREVLVAAKHLVDGHQVIQKTGGTVTYYHFLFDKHEIVFSEGMPTESFYPDRAAVGGLDADSRAELFALFPELAGNEPALDGTARLCLKRYEVEVLLQNQLAA